MFESWLFEEKSKIEIFVITNCFKSDYYWKATKSLWAMGGKTNIDLYLEEIIEWNNKFE